MFDTTLERKATKTELIEAQAVYNKLTAIHLTATYAGGKKSKGHGFWVNGYGYKSCEECRNLIQNIYLIPTLAQVESLTIGDKALTCFGKFEPVVEIFGRGKDINGKGYVCFYTSNRPGSKMSQSYKEGELVRTVALSGKHTSHQLDDIEQWMIENEIHQMGY